MTRIRFMHITLTKSPHQMGYLILTPTIWPETINQDLTEVKNTQTLFGTNLAYYELWDTTL